MKVFKLLPCLVLLQYTPSRSNTFSNSLLFEALPGNISGYCLRAQNDASSKVYILYPYSNEKLVLNLFFNKKMVREVKDGERIVYNLTSEGLLKLTLLATKSYVDPPTLSKNTRSVAIKRGKDYFFEISGKGEVNYLVNTEKAREKFNNRGVFRSEPLELTESVSDSLLQQ